MADTAKPTKFQLIRAIRELTGFTIRLGPFDEWEAASISHDQVMVMLTVYKSKELANGWRITAQATKVINITYKHEDVCWVMDEFVSWDDSFKGFEVRSHGRIHTPEAVRSERAWEQMCHRPGTPKTPLDNFDRVTTGPSNKKMEKYW